MQELKQIERAINQSMSEAPTLVGGLAVAFFKDRFNRQGFYDKRFEKWAERKQKDRRQGRAIGVDSGRLRRSPRVFQKTKTRVFVGTDVPYAQRFNDGFKGEVKQQVRSQRVREHSRRVRGKEQKVKAHTRSAHSRTLKVNQEARPFMRKSEFLDRRIAMNIEHEIVKKLRFLKKI